jgi:hypothetical protein
MKEEKLFLKLNLKNLFLFISDKRKLKKFKFYNKIPLNERLRKKYLKLEGV